MRPSRHVPGVMTEPDLSDDAAFQLVMDVAAGVADVEEIADRLRVSPR